MTVIRIDASRASNKQLRQEVDRLQKENANLQQQLTYIQVRMHKVLSKRKIKQIFGAQKPKKKTFKLEKKVSGEAKVVAKKVETKK